MRPIERIAVFTGIVVAILIALAAGNPGSAAVANQPQAPAQEPRFGTVDIYLGIEKLLDRPEQRKAREDVAAAYQTRASAIEKELQELQNDLRVLPQNSPDAGQILSRADAKQDEYQKLVQERAQELERVNSGQLIQAYQQVRDATTAVAQRLRYTHVFSNRAMDRVITTNNVAATLQEMLARPLVVGVPADDITAAVLDELKLTQ